MYKVTVNGNASATFDVHTSGEAKAAVAALTVEKVPASYVNLRIAKIRPISEKRLAWARQVIAKAEAQAAAAVATTAKKPASRPVARPSA